MPTKTLARVAKVFEKASTVDEVYAAAEAACNKCGESCRSRCPGYGSCGMFSVMNLKLDAIEALS